MLLVGLGNPGKKYEKTRHNAGFLLCDALLQEYDSEAPAKKFHGEFGKITIAGEPHFILKPQTFMNDSGRSVGAACQFYKIPAEEVVVFYDELDVVPGKVKLKQGGGSGGHNGIRSIDDAIGKNYWRVRLGIGHPGHKDAVLSYVLKNFSRRERPIIDDMVARVVRALPHFLAHDIERFMNATGNIQTPAKDKTKEITVKDDI